ncbi:hypothetical protein KSP40_PGU007754 [Platanthera guangdongensis]|uniref:SRR1-like domain-containing protein n=1 Tax=Platanthera guangdongensis TaxID=2320717 RepID=A0ABR2LUQ0_9ASPA
MEDTPEYLEILKDMMFCMRFVERTEIYKKLYNSLKDDRLLGKKIKEIVRRNSPRKMKIVIYNLGSIQFTWPSKFRLSLCLLLRKTLPTLFHQIDIADPTINGYELNVMVNLECSVFLSNEPDRKIDGPTMIYMPYADPILFESLLEANWSPLSLCQIVVFGSSYLPMMRDLQLKKSQQRIRRLTAIKDFVMQFNMCRELKGVFEDEEIAGRFENFGEISESPAADTSPSKWINYQQTIVEHCPMLALHFFNLTLKEWIRVAALVPSKHPSLIPHPT